MMRRLRRREIEGEALGVSALTPMVDMLTLTLLFLLKSWSEDPPVVVDESGFALPFSAGEGEAPIRLPIDVGEHTIFVNGRRVVGTAFYVTNQDMHVPEVYDAILARGAGPVSLRVDADVSWTVVRKVLFTLQEAGVQDVSLIAESRAGL
jgi:biopolymer transport protein ExbD